MVTNTYRLMIMDGLKERYPEYEFYTEKVTKNNGYCYDGIFVKLDESISYAPIIPCEEYEEALACDAMTLEEILDEIDRLLQTRFPLKNIPVLDFEQIKDKLRVRVVNYKKNQRRVKDMPHKQFFDLAIICRIVFVIDDNTEASIMVQNRLLSAWKITEEVLFETAYKNTFQDKKVRIRSMYDVLCSILEQEGKVIPQNMYDDGQMYVADMNTERDGSICILQKEALRQFAEEKGCDVYIIPSSIHELILVLNQKGADWKELRETLLRANKNDVLEEEVLSEHVYQYVRETDEIVDMCEA